MTFDIDVLSSFFRGDLRCSGRSSFFRRNCRNRFVVRTVCHCVLTAPKVNFFCPYFLCFFFSFFFFFFFSFHFFVWDYFYPKPLLFPRWGKLRTGHLEKMQTQVTEGVEDIDILCILKKNLWNFHGSWFLTLEFPPRRGVTEFFRICIGESLFSKRKVTNIKIPRFSFRKVYTGIKIREHFLTGHKFTNLLKSVFHWGLTFFYFLAFSITRK